jgi:peptide/nickel transport system substrate-binding protein
VEGFSTPEKRSERVVLEANLDYWEPSRFPRLKRIVFENTLGQKEAVELVKMEEGRIDVVTNLSPLDTLRVAQSPFAMVVKNRGSLLTVFGQFNLRKTGSPWQDIRLRQAVNLAVNREDLIHYAAKGNGEIIPALLPVQSFGYEPNLAPYPFDPIKARQLLHDAGHPDGLLVRLIAPEGLQVQATVVSKMLEQVGFQTDLQVLDPVTYNRKIVLSELDQPAEQQAWDIALTVGSDVNKFPVFNPYSEVALEGPFDWIGEELELRRLYEQVLRTLDQDQQQGLIRQMERHTHEQAYFLFLYNPIQLYAVNKAVAFVPYMTTRLILTETAVTEQHWSVRKQKAAVQE